MTIVKRISKLFSILAILLVGVLVFTACGDDDNKTKPTNNASITVSSTLKADAEEVLEIMKNHVLDKLTKVDEGNSNNQGHYTVAEAQEEVAEFTEYYVLVGTLSNVDDLTSVGFGNVSYSKDQTIPLSVGMNKFIEDKVYYVEDNKLYMAAPIVLVESAGQTKIKLNNKEVDFNVNPSVETIDFTAVCFCFDTRNTVVHNETDNIYVCTYREGAGKSMIGFYYEGMAQNDVSVNRLYKNGVLNSYSIVSNTDADKDSNYPLTYYFVPYVASGDVNEIDAEKHNNARFELKAYIQGKGVATANILNIIEYTDAE